MVVYRWDGFSTSSRSDHWDSILDSNFSDSFIVLIWNVCF